MSGNPRNFKIVHLNIGKGSFKSFAIGANTPQATQLVYHETHEGKLLNEYPQFHMTKRGTSTTTTTTHRAVEPFECKSYANLGSSITTSAAVFPNTVYY